MGKTRQATTKILLLLAIIVGGCSSDIATDDLPILLSVEAIPLREQIDISASQNQGFVDLLVRTIYKSPNVSTDTRFLTVLLSRYRVTYTRSDGGRTVPQGFVSALPATTIFVGTPGTVINNVQILNPNAFTQAPFAALLAQNGGVDPDTGQRFVKVTALIEVFGETLAGDDVTASVQIPYTFCNGCGNI